MYLGDGCYASFDGEFIWLRAPRENGDHLIALDAEVFSALMGFARSTLFAASNEPRKA